MMREIGLFFTVLLFISFAQNIVLAGGAGAELLLRRDGGRKGIYQHGGLVAAYSVVTVFVMWFLCRTEAFGGRNMQIVAVVLLMIVLYLISAALVRLLRNPGDNRLYKMLAFSCFNSLVFLLPFLQEVLGQELVIALGIAFGAGAGVLFSQLICARGFERLSHPDTPKPFRGMPGRLLFAGILSMALAAFSMRLFAV